MRKPLITAIGVDPIGVPELDEILGWHREKRLRLAFSAGLDGQLHVGGSSQALVTEILRLARMGAIAEEAVRKGPLLTVQEVVRDARARWRLEIGGE